MIQIGLEFTLSTNRTLILHLLALASIASGITCLHCQEDLILIYVLNVLSSYVYMFLYMCAYVHIDVSTCSGQMSIPVVFLNCSGFFFFLVFENGVSH